MVKLGKVTVIYTGTGFPKELQGCKEGKYPFYKVGDISKNVLAGYKKLMLCDNYIEEDAVKKIKGKILPKDTVVFAKIGEAVKLNRRAITTKECLVDNNVMGIAPVKSFMDINYLYYYMSFVKLENLAEATTVPSVKKGMIEDLEIDLPTLDTQRIISNIISEVDDLILLINKQLDDLNVIVKSRFVELFLQANESFPKKKLGECTVINPKKSMDTRLKEDLIVSFLPMASVGEDGSIDTSEKKLYREVKSGFTYFIEGDVLFAKITPCMENGKGAVAINLYNGIGFGSTEFHVIRSLEGFTNPVWLYNLSVSKKFRLEAEANMTGSAGQKRTPASFLQNYEIKLPPIELQNQFADFAEQVDKSKVVEVKYR